AAGINRGLEGPAVEIWGGGKADAAAGIGLGNAGLAGDEIHDPALALGVLHHPGIAEGPVMPVSRGVFFIVRARNIERQSVTDAGPIVAIGGRGVADALFHALFGVFGAGVKEMPEAGVVAQGGAGP